MPVKEAAVETHDEFVLRASRIFPTYRTLAWSRLERAVFNSLMAKLMFQRGYAAISDKMLLDLSESMEKVSRQCNLAIETSSHDLTIPSRGPTPQEAPRDCAI